ncbi:MAG TPA: adenylate/guanylate cyclase domain-containing protein [Gaiellales bacterium]|nr:adenylate/guanylate cyclase domain-containing protein [Gaiellales bacterium]
MSFPVAWDRRHISTLRFVDPELERAYQDADQAQGVRRARAASLLAAVVWVLVALIGPPAIGISAGSTWLIAGLMTVFLLACAGASRWAVTLARRSAIGLGQQVAAGIAVLTLARVTGTFHTYAMPGIMLTAVFGFSVTRPPFVGSIVLGVFYCVAFVSVAVVTRLGSQLWLQSFLVLATVVTASVGAYLLERSQREVYAQGRLVSALHDRVDALLRSYLSPDVAAALIEDPDRASLGGVEVDVTVLFADLGGYTAFAERATPTEVVAMLNAVFGAAVPVVLAEGGAVVQFMGDAMMAIFNAPKPQPDHALRAARSALGLQRVVGELPLAGTRPRFRVGLNSGPAIVGNIGAAEIRNFLAIGDTTNLAARLQTYAPEGSVVMGARTYDLIRADAIVRPLGTPALKGKAQPVEVWELLGLRGEDPQDL